MNEVLVVGDDWAAGYESDTGVVSGWPELLGIPMELRQGVPRSTADEWAANQSDLLSTAIETAADTVVVSLGASFLRQIAQDQKIEDVEVSALLSDAATVVAAVWRPTTIMMLYPDPHMGSDPRTRFAVPILNGALRMALGVAAATKTDGQGRRKGCLHIVPPDCLGLQDFDAREFMPVHQGHERLAFVIREMLEDFGMSEANPPRSVRDVFQGR